MNSDQKKINELTAEIAQLRTRLAEIEAAEAKSRKQTVELIRHRQQLEALAQERAEQQKKISGVLLREADERHRLQEALRREHSLLHMLMDNLTDTTIYFKDEFNQFTMINRAQARLLGLRNPEECVGKTDFDFFTPEHARAAFLDEQQIIQSGQPVVGKIEHIRNADGLFRWVSTTKMPIYDRNRKIIGTFGLTHDITTLK
ncbi:MAG: PAS domain-containing protein, partial [Chitinivibrionales bacterium]|nr:PAS domain-containing protein [Chitinivibrionales bacterium]